MFAASAGTGRVTFPIYPTLISLPTELVAERVTLRPLHPADGPAMLAAIEESRAELEPWMAWTPMQRTQDDAVDYCVRMAAEWLRRDSLTLAIRETASDRYLGGTGLHGIDWSLRAFEIGYWLRTSATGKGYMTEAVARLTRFAFESLGARRVAIQCDPRNVRSRAIPERLGWRQEAHLRNNATDTIGQPCDTVIFALTDDDWNKRLQEPGGRQ